MQSSRTRNNLKNTFQEQFEELFNNMTSSKYEYWWIVVSPKRTRILESNKEKRAIHYRYAIISVLSLCVCSTSTSRLVLQIVLLPKILRLICLKI